MKKLTLLSVIILFSLSSKAQVRKQNVNNDKVRMSFGFTLPKFGMILETRIGRLGGVGFDIPLLDDGTTFGEDYTETMSVNSVIHSLGDPSKGITYGDTHGFGVYYITPTYYGYDLSIGVGSVSQYQYRQFFDNHYILSKSGNYFVSTGETKKTTYTSIGLTKSIRISDMFNVDIKSLNRLYSNGTIEPTLGLSIRMGLGY